MWEGRGRGEGVWGSERGEGKGIDVGHSMIVGGRLFLWAWTIQKELFYYIPELY